MSDRQICAVILAGGSGSRLWPLSRQHLPKQFLSLEGDASLLQTTINRLSPVIGAKNVLIVTQESHAKGEAYHALLPYQTLFEPVARNTAPAIALAAAYLAANGDDPIMVVLPADHIIKDKARFHEHLNIAISAAESRYVSASRMKATSVPNHPVTTPPIAAPSVSIADQVTEEIAFAATSSRSETIEGITAVLAGSKNVESASCSTVSK